MNAYAELADDGTVHLHIAGAMVPVTRFALRGQDRMRRALQAHGRGWAPMDPAEFESWSADRLAELAAQGHDPSDPDPILTLADGDRQTETEATRMRRKTGDPTHGRKTF